MVSNEYIYMYKNTSLCGTSNGLFQTQVSRENLILLYISKYTIVSQYFNLETKWIKYHNILCYLI